MTVAAPEKGHPTQAQGYRHRDGQPDKLSPEAPGELCPDELALIEEMRAAGQYLSPRRAHTIYLKTVAAIPEREEFVPHLTRIVGDTSVTVDPTGDLIASQIDSTGTADARIRTSWNATERPTNRV